MGRRIIAQCDCCDNNKIQDIQYNTIPDNPMKRMIIEVTRESKKTTDLEYQTRELCPECITAFKKEFIAFAKDSKFIYTV